MKRLTAILLTLVMLMSFVPTGWATWTDGPCPNCGWTDYEKQYSKFPTCTEEGRYTLKCPNCGYFTGDVGTEIAKGHDEYITKENEIPATCIKEGSYDKVVRCNTCEWELGRSTVIVEKDLSAHDYKVISETPATCSAPGVRLNSCSLCGNTFSTIIPVDTSENGHKYSETVLKPATCTENGQKLLVCDYNGNHMKVVDIPIDENLHVYDEEHSEIVKPATETEDGIKKYTCKLCGKGVKTEPIPKLSITKYTISAYTSPTNIGATIQGTGKFNKDSTIQLYAPMTVDNGGVKYEFLYWQSGGTTSNNNPLNVTVDADKMYYAIYMPIEEKYTISAKITPAVLEGKVVIEGTGTFNKGQKTWLKAPTIVTVGGETYYFKFWQYADESFANPCEVVADANKIYYAYYEKEGSVKCTVTYKPGAYSTGSTYTDSVEKGNLLTLREEKYKRTGYLQAGWSLSQYGSTKFADLIDTVTITSDITLYPYWEYNAHKITVHYSSSSNPYANGKIYCGTIRLDWGNYVTVSDGGSRVFTVVCDPDYYAYVRLYGSGGYTSLGTYINNSTFTVSNVHEDKTLQVRFFYKTDYPPTGDNNNLGLWCLLAVSSAMCGAATIISRKRREH